MSDGLGWYLWGISREILGEIGKTQPCSDNQLLSPFENGIVLSKKTEKSLDVWGKTRGIIGFLEILGAVKKT